MDEKEKERQQLLLELLPNVSSQLSGALSNIGIAVSKESKMIGYFYSSNPQVAILDKSMHVKSHSDACISHNAKEC